MASAGDRAWQSLRYGTLLPAAGRSVARGRAYAALVAAVEHARDAERRRVAEARIARWLGVPGTTARALFRAALFSEGLEEADSARFMRDPSALDAAITITGDTARAGRPRIYGAMHLGTPVLAYLGLCRRVEPGLPLIARELDENNPMPAKKQAFARGKVAWVESAGVKFFGTSTLSVLRARERLRDGKAICAAVDVPGDVVTHRATMTLCGEALSFASGIFDLAVMTGADVQLVASCHRDGAIQVSCRPPVAAASEAELAALVAREMEAVVRALPGEWWLWPYVLPARNAGAGG